MVGTRASVWARGWDGSSPAMEALDGAGPLGFTAGDTNLYRYVGDSPADSTDPLGLYMLKWRGKWTQAQKNRVVSGFKQVAARVRALIALIDAEKNSLSPCELKALGPDLDKLREILSKIDENMNNNNYVIDVYHCKMGWWTPNIDTVASMYGDDDNWFENPDLNLNDRNGVAKTNWMTMPLVEFSAYLLHELSHLHGSEDDKTDANGNLIPQPWYMSAQEIQKLMKGGLGSIGAYNLKKGQVQKNCGG
ncbi:MAG: RHS repeat-associated core domain-containing protein [Isosphaeraceae bacterium]